MERRLKSGAAWTERETLYDGMGQRTAVSEWSLDGATRTWTSFLDYDPFGRPGTITPPDGADHNIVLTYIGARQVKRRIQVGTGRANNEIVKNNADHWERVRSLMDEALELRVLGHRIELENVGAGHDVPTGMATLRDIWVDVAVFAPDGHLLVTLDRAAVPETLGGAGLLFEQFDPLRWAEAVRRLVEDAELREALVTAGRDRARAFERDVLDEAVDRLLAGELPPCP